MIYGFSMAVSLFDRLRSARSQIVEKCRYSIVIVTMVAMAMLIVAMPAIPCHTGANMMVSTSAPDRRDLPRWRLRISVIFRRWTMEDLGRPHLVCNADVSATMPRGLARRN